MSVDDAIRQFEDNVDRMGPDGPLADPEKHNLYCGLLNLARALKEFHLDLQKLLA